MVFSIKNVAIASAFLSLAQGSVVGKRALTGQATSYGGNTNGGACSFSTYTLPSNILGTAVSDSNWSTAANCGRCVSVTGPSGNSITAMITDECPGCGTNHLDLYQNAFTKLASLSVGIINVSWNYVPCPITTPLQVHLKEGVSAYWFSMQVVNAAEGVSKLEVSTDGSKTWKSTTRTTYNFFENSSGFGTTSVDVKVTGLSGGTVIIKNVKVTPGLVVTASSNLKTGTTKAKSIITATSEDSDECDES
ncbi:f5a762c2-5399-49a2-965f-211a76cab4dd [Sclerotinia trifoliorum]|uniref:F5a762c2-5399-49a2-965f-211a76cab4dd n=1 Tax=Sclerotinia trifoliorum TaxID=28548 RepID=A0A8H2W0N6_9HELO|nr:f5a762c2-5399-49a2-965f-211a76cab4dd [Sclerotinia trifoliorum]